MKKISAPAISLLFSFLAAVTASAAEYYWTGAASSDYTDPGNWVSGKPDGKVATTAPINNDYSDRIHFTDDANPVIKRVIVPAGRQIGKIFFENTSGWTIDNNGTFLTKNGISATGCSGTVATFANDIKFSTATIDVNSGAALQLNKLYLDGSNQLTCTGGGTVSFSWIDGWSKDRAVIVTGDARLIVRNASPFGGNLVKYVSLASLGARFQYQATPASAESRFAASTAEASSGSFKIVAGYTGSTAGYFFEAVELEDGFVEVGYVRSNAPAINAAELARDGDDLVVDTSVYCPVDCVVTLSLSDGTDAAPVTSSLSVASGESRSSFTVDRSLLAADTTYEATVTAANDSGSDSAVAGSLYNGALSLSWVSDAFENAYVPGTVTVSRAVSSPIPLVVCYSFSGTVDHAAVEGVNYAAPSGTVTIPAGAASAVIEVVPLLDAETAHDTTLLVALEPGCYVLPAENGVTVAVKDFSLPVGFNSWVASPESDGLASTAANWSEGRVPVASDHILLGVFSQKAMTWDAGVNGLPAAVASWTQDENFAGTVTFPTTFDDTFPVFAIAGDCTVENGVWTHPANGASPVNRLAVSVGGDFTLAASAKIDVNQKGLTGLPAGRSRGVYAGGNRTSLAVFGDVYEPTDLGLGGTKLPGGGAVYLDIAGDAVLNGRVTAISSDNTNGWTDPGSGTGGSVYIRAASVSGSGSVNVSAPQIDRNNAAASGGRIAVVLTEAEELGLPAANLTAYGAEGTNDGSTVSGASGAGTVLVKTAAQDHGTLYVKNRRRSLSGTYGLYPQSPYGTTQIPAGATWTFDEVVVSGSGVLMVPAGATLRLPNGFASVSGPAPAALNSLVLTAGILYYGGTIDVGDAATHTLQGGWVFDAHSGAPYTFHGDVVVKDGAALGQLRFFHNASANIVSDLRVDGDLTVESTGYLYARGTGYSFFGESDGTFSHGGQIGWYGVTNIAAYGSVLHPSTAGSVGIWDDSASQYPGGGALKLTVSGALALDGVALSDGAVENGDYNPHGAGGSLDITAASLSGSGSIRADGFQNSCENDGQVVKPSTTTLRSKFSASAGGRVAVRLTGDGAVFSPEWVSRITAKGCPKGKGYIASMSSGGTVYLQDASAAEGAGTVYIRNRADSAVITDAWTPFPSTKKGGEDEDFRKAELYVGDNARVMQTVADSRVLKATLETGTKYDLRGGILRVKRLVIAGEKVPAGVYLASDAEVSACFQDTLPEGQTVPGAVMVVPDGTAFLLK